MTYTLPDRFIWDFWTLTEGATTHLFALTAPRDPDPETRHDRARIDRFSSQNLIDWVHHGVAIERGAPGDWDDLSTWTGSVARDPAGGYAMMYTGRSRAEPGQQRLGLARTDDLVAWTKHDGPVLEADPARHRTGDVTHFRDPWIWHDGETWHTLVTAQHPGGDYMRSGTLAHATSPDLVDWTWHDNVVDQPLAEVLEVPQRLDDGRALIATHALHMPPDSPFPRAFITAILRPEGDRLVYDRTLEAAPTDCRYMLRHVVPGQALCWIGRRETGPFMGGLSRPFDPGL